MQELINEYRGALQDVQKVKANLQKKIDAEKRSPLEAGQKRTFQEVAEKTTMSKLKSIIDSLEYSVEWMELGHEPAPRRAIHRRSGLQREICVTDIEKMRQWFAYEHGNAYEFEENEPKISEWDKIRMEDAMSTMSEQEKKVFLLKHEKNLSLSQISDELEISIRTVRSYLSRGEEKIQQQIDGSLFCMAI
ncbi:sigma-70 family RNA polymerase sigma factor [Listeria monocytogenes]|nr:sigma-70 family RNA polymerase sigma factor [Listeria monocytogenes]